ncbi:MAG: hypothetical protein Q9219_003310 [cf. Caloplaca sp. 3 TL-2023]
MEHSMGRSIIDDAVLKIVNYPAKSRSSTSRSPPLELPIPAERQQHLSRLTSAQNSASLSPDYKIADPHDCATEKPTPLQSLNATQHPDHHITQKQPHFVRLPIPDEFPAAGFAFVKLQQPTFNFSSYRGPAAAIRGIDTINQTASSTTTAHLGDSALSSEVDGSTARNEVDLSKESDNEKTSSEADDSARSTTSSLTSSKNLQVTPSLDHESMAFTEDQSPQKEHMSATSSETSTCQHDPTSGSAQSEQEGLRSEDAEIKDRRTSPDENRRDQDAEMLDGQTVVNEPTQFLTENQTEASSILTDEGLLAKSEVAAQTAERLQRQRSTLPESQQSETKDTQMGPEALLKGLNTHYQRLKHQEEELRAREQARNRDIQDLQTISQALHHRLQETEGHMAKQEEELIRYRQLVPRCKDRLKRLGDFIKGLGNDHTRLREFGGIIEVEQKLVRKHQDSISNILRQKIQTMENERKEYEERISKLHDTSKMLEQGLNTRSIDLLQESARLRVEQGRNKNLEEDRRKSTAQYEEVTARLSQHEALLSSKIADLQANIQLTIRNTESIDGGQISNKLDECLQLLKVPPTKPVEATDIVHELEPMRRELTESVSQLLSAFGCSAEAITQLEGKLASQFQANLEQLNSKITANLPLQEQIMGLREAKATLVERLQAIEMLFRESRDRAITLENREKTYLEKTTALETELNALRNQLHDSALVAVKLHEAEKEYTKMKEQLSVCRCQLETRNAQVEIHRRQASDLQDLLESTKIDLAEQQDKVAAVVSEKAAVERRAASREENVRAELSQICKDEVARSTEKFHNEIRGLRHQISATEDRVRAEKQKAEQLQTEISVGLENAKRKDHLANELQEEAKLNRQTISQLKQEVEEACRQDLDKERELENVQDELTKLREAQSQKEEVIQSLRSRFEDVETTNSKLFAEKAKSDERLKQSEESLANTQTKLEAQEVRIRELTQTVSDKSNPQPAKTSGSAQPLRNNECNKRKSVINEDSRPGGPKELLLESRDNLDDTHERQREPLSSSDDLSREDPLSYMPKEIQDMVARSSSPLTDTQSVSSPVVDGSVKLPRGLRIGQQSRTLVKEPSKTSIFKPLDTNDRYKTPTQGNVLAYNKSTITSTKSRLVASSIIDRSPSRSSHFPGSREPQARSLGKASPQPPNTRTADSQLASQLGHVSIADGLKRVRPAATADTKDPQSHTSKRRRLSSETEKHKLGPTQASPVKPAGISRRKTTLRRSQRGKWLLSMEYSK